MTDHQQSSSLGASAAPGISAFFPAYNDGETIPTMVLTALLAVRRFTDDHEFVLVNEGSKDFVEGYQTSRWDIE